MKDFCIDLTKSNTKELIDQEIAKLVKSHHHHHEQQQQQQQQNYCFDDPIEWLGIRGPLYKNNGKNNDSNNDEELLSINLMYCLEQLVSITTRNYNGNDCFSILTNLKVIEFHRNLFIGPDHVKWIKAFVKQQDHLLENMKQKLLPSVSQVSGSPRIIFRKPVQLSTKAMIGLSSLLSRQELQKNSSSLLFQQNLNIEFIDCYCTDLSMTTTTKTTLPFLVSFTLSKNDMHGIKKMHLQQNDPKFELSLSDAQDLIRSCQQLGKMSMGNLYVQKLMLSNICIDQKETMEYFLSLMSQQEQEQQPQKTDDTQQSLESIPLDTDNNRFPIIEFHKCCLLLNDLPRPTSTTTTIASTTSERIPNFSFKDYFCRFSNVQIKKSQHNNISKIANMIQQMIQTNRLRYLGFDYAHIQLGALPELLAPVYANNNENNIISRKLKKSRMRHEILVVFNMCNFYTNISPTTALSTSSSSSSSSSSCLCECFRQCCIMKQSSSSFMSSPTTDSRAIIAYENINQFHLGGNHNNYTISVPDVMFADEPRDYETLVYTIMEFQANYPPFTMVKNLNLAGIQIGQAGLQYVLDRLDTTQLQSLDLSNTGMSNIQLTSMASHMNELTRRNKTTQLTRLDLSYCSITVDSILDLLQATANTLQVLRIKSINMTNYHIRTLVEQINSNQLAPTLSLQHLDISDNYQISNWGITYIFQLASLKELTLRGIYLTDRDLINLATTLQSNTSWSRITVSVCDDVDDESIANLVSVFETCQNITLQSLIMKCDEVLSNQEKLDYYVGLNRIGRYYLRQVNFLFPPALFPNVIENANDDPSLVYWIIRASPHSIFFNSNIIN